MKEMRKQVEKKRRKETNKPSYKEKCDPEDGVAIDSNVDSNTGLVIDEARRKCPTRAQQRNKHCS